MRLVVALRHLDEIQEGVVFLCVAFAVDLAVLGVVLHLGDYRFQGGLGSLLALEALDHLLALEALDHLEALEALDHLEALEALDHLLALLALEALEALEALVFLLQQVELVSKHQQ